jgi:UDP-N-acetylglucosamine pyrophosphorylase
MTRLSGGSAGSSTAQVAYLCPLQCFLFDPFYLSTKMAVLEGERAEEFTPVKNAPGNPVDSPDSARAAISVQHTKWVGAAGAKVRRLALSNCSSCYTYGCDETNGYQRSYPSRARRSPDSIKCEWT